MESSILRVPLAFIISFLFALIICAGQTASVTFSFKTAFVYSILPEVVLTTAIAAYFFKKTREIVLNYSI